MKKLIAMILAAAMLLCFCACGDDNAPDSKEGKGDASSLTETYTAVFSGKDESGNVIGRETKSTLKLNDDKTFEQEDRGAFSLQEIGITDKIESKIVYVYVQTGTYTQESDETVSLNYDVEYKVKCECTGKDAKEAKEALKQRQKERLDSGEVSEKDYNDLVNMIDKGEFITYENAGKTVLKIKLNKKDNSFTVIKTVSDEPAKTEKVYTYFEDTEYEGKISHSLTVGEDKTFVLNMSFSHKMGEDDCELIKVDYSEGVTNSTLYYIRGSYTVDGEGKLIPTITKVLYKEMYITDAGKDVSANVLDYLEECHENGEVKDSIYEMYLKILKGEWTDIASEFTPEIHYFEINDSDMTFDYSASGL